MNFRLKNMDGAPSDQEIERDVAELHRLLDGVEGPREPHPAYWQNFLVHVRGRIDEDRFRRKRRIPSIALASATAVALIAIVLVGRLDRVGDPFSTDIPGQAQVARGAAGGARIDQNLLASNVDPLLDQGDTHRLVLNEDDVKMLDAIMIDSDAAVFKAMVDSDQR